MLYWPHDVETRQGVFIKLLHIEWEAEEMKRFFHYLTLTVIVVVLLAGCGTSGDIAANNSSAPASNDGKSVLSRVKESGLIRVGFEGTYAPFNYLNDQKQYDGFDVDISNEIAKRLGVKAEFVATKWDGLIGGLNADKFDIIIAQMSITEERKKSVDFTDPYVVTGGVLVTRTDTNDVTKLEDLKGKKVGVGAGTTFEDVARKIEGADVRTYKSVNEYVQDLLNKRLDVIINDQLVMGYNIKSKNLPIQIKSDIVNEDVIGMAVKKGNSDFVEAVNKAIAEIKQDGTYQTLYMKWFGVKPAEK
jgi:cystine transport system substrate-binding protein